ncbi:MAG: hypothetical protein E3K32_07010 [wastewater metagenome]|nr:hypothetical protein [Candidatus Loosdrechtia aerotolerans]
MNNQHKASKGNSIICGLAFDNEDNHKRITTGENFCILGGSEKTHENLVDMVLEFNEAIKKYGKKLDYLSENEYYDIIKEISKDNEKTYWLYHA